MKNEFADALHELINKSGIKMLNVAVSTGYDLSYISKWASGKILPSDKTIDKINRSIAECVVSTSDEEHLNELLQAYGCTDAAGLQNTVEDMLNAAYRSSKGMAGSNKTIELFDHISIKEMLKRVDAANQVKAGDFIAIIDLFSLDHDSRLEFAGIRDGRNESRKPYCDSQVTIVICMDNVDDVVYDCLYLLHLISVYSDQKLSIYNSPIANGKILYIADRAISVSGIVFPQDKTCTAVTVADDADLSQQLYQAYMQQVNRGSMMLQAVNIHDFLYSRGYIKSMLSEDNRWLIGHVTELMLPPALFDEMLGNVDVDDPAEYRAIYDFSQGIIRQGAVRIMLYETLISDLLATGEIDFFNHKLQFTSRQMTMFIEHLLHLNDSEISFRMIQNGFSVHFEHMYNPCLFISGTKCYMRLENAYDRDNIIICSEPSLSRLINRFYDEAWNNRADVVIEDRDTIRRILTHYRTMSALLGHSAES